MVFGGGAKSDDHYQVCSDGENTVQFLKLPYDWLLDLDLTMIGLPLLAEGFPHCGTLQNFHRLRAVLNACHQYLHLLLLATGGILLHTTRMCISDQSYPQASYRTTAYLQSEGKKNISTSVNCH